MEITRPTIDTSFGVHAWIDRRRDEYERTSKSVRVIGVVGWTGLALSALMRLG